MDKILILGSNSDNLGLVKLPLVQPESEWVTGGAIGLQKKGWSWGKKGSRAKEPTPLHSIPVFALLDDIAR